MRHLPTLTIAAATIALYATAILLGLHFHPANIYSIYPNAPNARTWHPAPIPDSQRATIDPRPPPLHRNPALRLRLHPQPHHLQQLPPRRRHRPPHRPGHRLRPGLPQIQPPLRSQRHPRRPRPGVHDPQRKRPAPPPRQPRNARPPRLHQLALRTPPHPGRLHRPRPRAPPHPHPRPHPRRRALHRPMRRLPRSERPGQ